MLLFLVVRASCPQELYKLNAQQLGLSNIYLSEANLSISNLNKTNLNQAKLIKLELPGADLSGATLTGAKLYATLRFGLKIEGMTCQWLDLSVNSDCSIIQNFTPAQAKEFFSATPPITMMYPQNQNILCLI
ncbi:pentapeptide repeat-containing protein [Cuspidothrix issatschenkoi LEGE 03284]|uniref:pentapeptide repeat-containing protein n=1 Tax=Cuspidothrix issatschenkoi TaxID=230752 RepID=UPI00187E4DF2|nr:pentapeptide repeat-containing protein [Cuspidothrix issatschenkoi LEGE 03284]